MAEAISKHATINGADLEYWDIGSGPPVLFVHGGMGAECSKILREPALTSRYRLIHFQRRGYGGSSCPKKPVSFAQQSADCQALLEGLGVPMADVVGQSYGGAISLQFALDAPEMVRSLTLIEPPIPSVIFASEYFASLGQQAGELYQQGHPDQAVELFGKAVIGEQDWDAFAEEWLETWIGDAEILFESDLPALAPWVFDRAAASRIKQPILNLRGVSTPEIFEMVWQTVPRWIPHARSQVITDASHCVLQMNPAGAAQAIIDHLSDR
jgi:pimeloyl-ACP methyl ester carboxylesterase